MNTPSSTWEAEADLVVIGGGVAGLTAARAASVRGLRVLTLSKGGPTDTSTQYAQGGIAVVAPHGDSVEAHVRDTLAAGAGLCDPAVVRSVVEGGRAAVAALSDLGAVFDLRRDGQVSRTREGGHSTRRIIHAGGDATGAEVQRALNAAGLPVLFGTAAVDIVTGPDGVRGVITVSDKGFGVVHSPAVLLATGGLGQLYACSTNPPGATADGIALALRAGATVADLEFVQFHPTVLYTPGALGRRPLISEAVRGEGATLVDANGEPVTAGAHPRGDLAPRDVVSRTIAARMRALGADHVYLDARAIDGFAQRFPTITASCLAAGVDPRSDPIPVAPAAHYQCGGIVTDAHGRTAVAGLYAAGEVARTGLHGANRLASNSLLEGLVVGERAGAVAAERLGERVHVTELDPVTYPRADRESLQELMTDHASVVRDSEGLRSAVLRVLQLLSDSTGRPAAGHGALTAGSADGSGERNRPATDSATEMAEGAPAEGISATDRDRPDPRDTGAAATITALEDAALTLTARAFLVAATARTESRGCHTRSDHPESRDDLRRSLPVRLGPDGRPQLVAEGTGPAGTPLAASRA
ncbi:L-aspartate oxidase [Nocardia sp. BMG51109]|uniref:L-aspartate oxidase n=1 Tax=Nocardia sp. BMG51109 TaxID=1056816 RepID=UPI000465251F|nr:L-aspartate oxidase [Nocardia sp. BMG51109]